MFEKVFTNARAGKRNQPEKLEEAIKKVEERI
jgi:hypothetical protein